MKVIKPIFIWNIFLIFCCSLDLSFSQETEKTGSNNDYISLFNKAEYNEALQNIRKKLQIIYNGKNDYLRIPEDLIYIDKEKNRKDLNRIFTQRKVDKYFIEENPELFQLHLFAARCYYKTGKENAALNHYYNSLRYKKLQKQKDDYIYYEISQVYKNLNYFDAYINALETAYSLNSASYEYSLELGKSLSITPQKKKAIFHLKRYIESKGDDVDENLFLTLGNMYEDIGKYLDTAYYYKKYLEKKENDGYVIYALGYIAYKKIGNHKLALESFKKSLKYLPDNDFLRRSKASEYQGDMYLSDREFELAKQYYKNTKIYHDKIQNEIQKNGIKITELNNKLQEIKSTLKSKNLYDRYNEYQSIKEEKGKIEFKNKELRYAFNKLNSGYIRWTLAELYERTDDPKQAIKYYSEAISYNYNTNNARDRINKLKLKINRGY